MRATFIKYWDALHSSYWFFPAIMAVFAAIFAFLLTALDARYGAEWLLERAAWFHTIQPSGARTVLSTIAGSMITVAGVTFSITIAAVAFASSQFGPRILTNFMEDRGNQVTLGTFIATYLYCLLVLRAVRSPDESAVLNGAVEAFVPQMALLLAVLLALASIGVLIYFIHHVPESIHVSNVIARIGREFQGQLDRRFPQMIGSADDAEDEPAILPVRFLEDAVPVHANRDGYVHNIDSKGLLHLTERHDLVVQVVGRPGTFAASGHTLMLAWPPDRVDEDVRHAISECVAQGSRRTAVQDLLFPVDELVEIAARALSPGVNDPFTAMSCMDWLAGGLVHFSRRVQLDAYRYDDNGELRVLAYPTTFHDYADAFFDQLNPYASADRNAALHLMKIITQLLLDVPASRYRTVLVKKADALLTACRKNLSVEADLEAVVRCHQAVENLAMHYPHVRLVATMYPWLNGQV